MTNLLNGKVAVITGAASAIGDAIARKFVANGAKVILTDLNKYSYLQSRATALTTTKTNAGTAGSAEALQCDVKDPNAISQLMQHVNKNHSGQLDIFYNNAGINDDVSPMDIQNFKDTMAVHVESVLESIKQAGSVMRNQKSGCILCTGSTMGFLGDVVPSAYSISKTALVGVIRAAAAELAKDNVRVNAISPYGVAPSNFDKLVLGQIFPSASGQELNDMISKYMSNRRVTVDDVADAAVYLASDAGKSVTGHNLVLNGRFTL